MEKNIFQAEKYWSLRLNSVAFIQISMAKSKPYSVQTRKSAVSHLDLHPQVSCSFTFKIFPGEV